MSNKKGLHYAWYVMLGLGFLTAGSVGCYTVLIGSFLPYASNSLHVQYSQFSYFFTALLLALAATLPFVNGVLEKHNVPLILTTATVVETIIGFLMASFTKVWEFYIGAIIIGICMAFLCMVPMAVILDNWFDKKVGLANGICWSINSIFLAVMSPLITHCITNYGWRHSFIILAIIGGIFMIPAALFVIRYKPSDKGLQPYGYDPNKKQESKVKQMVVSYDIPTTKILKSPAFVIMALILCAVQLISIMNQVFPTYSTVSGLGAETGGFMVSCAMIFDLAFNPLMGWTCDKFGAEKSLLVWTALSIISFIVLIIATMVKSSSLAIFGAGINDVMYVFCGTGITTLTMFAFKGDAFDKAFSYVVSIGYIVSSFGMPIIMNIYQHFGNFYSVFIYATTLDVIIFILIIAVIHFPFNKASNVKLS
ncbi:MFS transporter [Limosilactobacillus vaginalis]|uniref:MFS transporter n=1 Tax=Limosilactobacillus vaginalis TaxID=1633 RepID=UPI0022A8E558|nr:MFS transporter [Limosilactobacillus vaginalis]MCZ2466524.1 MFS transporter [Limosilactobacillus vaginalis]